MFLQSVNYSPDDTPGIGTSEIGKEDIIDLLGSDDESNDKTDEGETETPKKETDDTKEDEEEVSKDEDDEEKEKDLEDELEEDLEEPDEEDLELVTPVRRREILSKYPNLFKEFPALEKSYYREQKYAEILPTIQDAQAAAEKSELLDSYGMDLAKGDSTRILTDTKQSNPEAFNRIVDNYLPNLHKADEAAYYHVVGNLMKHTIKTMVDQDDETLTVAAKYLNKFLFGTDKWTAPTNLSSPETDNPKEKELSEREQKFNETQRDTHLNNLDTRITNTLKSTIDKNIDPKGSMTDYVKRNVSKEVLTEVQSTIESDRRFTSIISRLWERAENNGYDSESMDKIRSAYLSKAKTVLPTVIKTKRNEALKGLGRKVSDGSNRGPLPVGQTRRSTSISNSGKSPAEKAKEIPKDMSTKDYLMQD